MDNSFVTKITKYRGMNNVEQGMNIYHLLSQVLIQGIPGNLVELGCHSGSTAAIMKKTMNLMNSEKELHLYDSFEGIPSTSKEDEGTKLWRGSCKSTKKDVIDNFNKFDLDLPIIHKGWFKDTLPNELPEKICFAHLDGDLYNSIKISLESIYNRISKGGVILIDDYYDSEVHKKIEKDLNENKRNIGQKRRYIIKDVAPGVKKAVDEFLRDKKEEIFVLVSGDDCHAYFKKL